MLFIEEDGTKDPTPRTALRTSPGYKYGLQGVGHNPMMFAILRQSSGFDPISQRQFLRCDTVARPARDTCDFGRR